MVGLGTVGLGAEVGAVDVGVPLDELEGPPRHLLPDEVVAAFHVVVVRVLVVVHGRVRSRRDVRAGLVSGDEVEGKGGHARREVALEDGVGLLESVDGAEDLDPRAGKDTALSLNAFDSSFSAIF